MCHHLIHDCYFPIPTVVGLMQIYPAHAPDLSSGCPVLIWGRYTGSFPDNVEVDGTLADLSKFEITIKAQNAKDIPIDRVRFHLLYSNNFLLQMRCPLLSICLVMDLGNLKHEK